MSRGENDMLRQGRTDVELYNQGKVQLGKTDVTRATAA